MAIFDTYNSYNVTVNDIPLIYMTLYILFWHDNFTIRDTYCNINQPIRLWQQKTVTDCGSLCQSNRDDHRDLSKCDRSNYACVYPEGKSAISRNSLLKFCLGESQVKLT